MIEFSSRDGDRDPMEKKRFIMNAGRTTKQGQQINVGKDHAEYQAIVSTMNMHPDGHEGGRHSRPGSTRPRPVRIRRGDLHVRRRQGPAGHDLRPVWAADLPSHGPDTDGTGMPTSKGWEVEVEPI